RRAAQPGSGGGGSGARAEEPLALGELVQRPFPGPEGGQFLPGGEGAQDPGGDGTSCGRKLCRRPVGEDHRGGDARRREDPGGQDGPAGRGEQGDGGDDGGGPRGHGGQDRDGSADHQILGLLGVADQPGQQIAAVPAGQPAGDQLGQAPVKPSPQVGLEAESETVAGQPLDVAGGAAQEREQLHRADGDREQQDRRGGGGGETD